MANRARARSKKRKRKQDAEASFESIIADVFGIPDDAIVDELAKETTDETDTNYDLSQGSIPGQDAFMKKQSEIDKKSKS